MPGGRPHQAFSHSTALRGEACPHALQAPCSEEREVQAPVSWGAWFSFACSPTLAGRDGATRTGDQGVQVGAPRQPCLLPTTGRMHACPRPPCPLDAMVGLSHQGARPWPLGGGEDRRPARLLLLDPAPDACAVGGPRCMTDVVRTVASPLPPRPPPPALARPGEQAVALRAPGLAPRCCARHPFLRPREERVPPAEAEAGPRAHGPQTPGRAVDALDADRPDPIRRLLLRRRAWPPAIGRRKGRGTGRGGRAARPAHPARDHRGQSPPGRAPRAVRRIGQARDGQWEPPPGQHAPQPGLPQRPPQTIPHHGRALGAPRAPRHTQPPHAWPTAPHGRPPVASSASARRKAAGLCTRLDPGSSGGAREGAHPAGHGHHARGGGDTRPRDRSRCVCAASPGYGQRRGRTRHTPWHRSARERRSLHPANQWSWCACAASVELLCPMEDPQSSASR